MIIFCNLATKGDTWKYGKSISKVIHLYCKFNVIPTEINRKKFEKTLVKAQLNLT